VALSLALSLAILTGAAGFGGGVITGRTQTGAVSAAFASDGGAPSGVDLSPVWRAWRVIDERFVPTSVATTSDEQPQDPETERVYGMISGLAASLGDPYTFFLPPVEQKQFEDDMSGAFEGVGMEIAVRDEVLTVVSPLKQSPAERAGLKAGDRILKINDTETRGMDITTAVSKIRGPKGTAVKLTVLRDGWTDTQVIEVVRDVISVPIVTTEVRGDVYIIQLSSFTANSPALFRNALREFIETGATKLIIDLRGNPGGYLDAAVDMASWFLPAGKVVVTEDYAGNQENISHRSRGYDVFNDALKVVILVDKGSASASEILALALKSHGKATLVGATTFGKGSVQELVEITPDTALKITVARWIGPNGEPIPHTGIVPDVEVKPTEEEAEAKKDVQLEKALEILEGN